MVDIGRTYGAWKKEEERGRKLVSRQSGDWMRGEDGVNHDHHQRISRLERGKSSLHRKLGVKEENFGGLFREFRGRKEKGKERESGPKRGNSPTDRVGGKAR